MSRATRTRSSFKTTPQTCSSCDSETTRCSVLCQGTGAASRSASLADNSFLAAPSQQLMPCPSAAQVDVMEETDGSMR
eukprot:5052114-Pleurochrysis_carterae.AAC.3